MYRHNLKKKKVVLSLVEVGFHTHFTKKVDGSGWPGERKTNIISEHSEKTSSENEQTVHSLYIYNTIHFIYTRHSKTPILTWKIQMTWIRFETVFISVFLNPTNYKLFSKHLRFSHLHIAIIHIWYMNVCTNVYVALNVHAAFVHLLPPNVLFKASCNMYVRLSLQCPPQTDACSLGASWQRL